MATAEAITAKFKEFGEDLKTKSDSSGDWSRLDLETENLIRKNPFAFLIAMAFDRGMRWERAYQIPVEIEQKGCLDPKQLAGMTNTELCKLLEGLKIKPRYGAIEGSKTLADAAHLVCEKFDGDAAAIWTSSSPCEVEKTLQKIHGISAGIASMTTRILHEKFGCFKGQERQIDIKPDIHLLRVFKRTGLIEKKSEGEARKVAQKLNPEFPGALDPPAWEIGKSYCHPKQPDCAECPLTEVCAKQI